MIGQLIGFAIKIAVVVIWLAIVVLPTRWLALWVTRQCRAQAFKPRVAWALGRGIFWSVVMVMGVCPALGVFGVTLSSALNIAWVVTLGLTLLETFGKEPHAFETPTQSATPQTEAPLDTPAVDLEHVEALEKSDPPVDNAV